MSIQKTYQYKVYSPLGVYLGLLQNVVSDFSYNSQIATAGTQISVTVQATADNIALAVRPIYDEGGNAITDENSNIITEDRQPDIVGDTNANSTMVADNLIIVYEYSQYWPNGLQVFSGYISKWKATFGADNNIILTCISNGQDLSNYLIQSGDTAIVTQATDTGNTVVAGGNSPYQGIIQSFQIASTYTISAVSFELTTTQLSVLGAGLYKQLGSTPNPNTDPVIASGAVNVNTITQTVTKIAMDTPTSCVAGIYYFLLTVDQLNGVNPVNVFYSSSDPYTNGALYTITSGALSWNAASLVSGASAYFIVYKFGGNVIATYTSVDPTVMLTGIMNDYIARGGYVTMPSMISPLVQMPLKDGTLIGAQTYGYAGAQVINPATTMTINMVQLLLGAYTATGTYKILLCQGNPQNDSWVVGALTGTYTLGGSNVLIDTSNSASISSAVNTLTTFTFNTPHTLTGGSQYYIVITATDANSYTVGAASSHTYPLGYASVGQFFKAYGLAASTTYPMTTSSTYPGMYISLFYSKSLQVNPNGGFLNTGNITSYEFKVQTILQGIQAVLSLAPANWYWYVDPGTNVLNFAPANTVADVTLIKGRHLEELDIEATKETIKNNVYITAGDDGTGTNTNIFVQVTSPIGNNRIGMALISDNRINSTNGGVNTATLIAQSYLNQYASQTYITNVTVLDGTMDTNLFKLGMMVGFAGFGTFVEQLLLQIVAIQKNPDSVTLQLGSLPVQSTGVIEQLNALLTAQQTVNNPVTPV